VSRELNRLAAIFKSRNPDFNGQISLIGHSLGSLIVFDLLSHQQVEAQVNESQKSQDVLTSNKTDFSLGSLDPDAESVLSARTAEQVSARPNESIEQFLSRLKLDELKPLFNTEMITMESLVNSI
jgi:hypothetical protein